MNELKYNKENKNRLMLSAGKKVTIGVYFLTEASALVLKTRNFT